VIKKYLLLAVALLIGYRYFTAPPPGFCVTQNRFITDEEYIKRAISVMHKGQKVVDGKRSTLRCCYVIREEGGFLSKMFRVDEGVSVSWSFERTEEAWQNDISKDKYYQVAQTIDTCATTIFDDIGISTKYLSREEDYQKSSNFIKFN
jgi:hypothetical protein